MNKRAIAILGAIFILIVGALGFLIYSRSKSKSPNDNTNTVVVDQQTNTDANQSNTPVETPSATLATKLSDDKVISPILFYQGNGISYFNSQGQLFQTDLQVSDKNVLLSNKRELTIPLKSNITQILWPQAGNSFIAEFGTGKKTWSYYDSSKGTYVDLPNQIYSLDWAPTGDKIVYVYVSNGKATLSTANADATGFKTLANLNETDIIIDESPDGQNIAFYRNQTQDTSNNRINVVSSDGKTFRAIVKDGYNKGITWSPDSKKFLFTKLDQSAQKYGLWVADITSGEIRNLGFYTSENKAVWAKDSQTVYVAVPTKGTPGQGLTEDTLYQINISTLEKQEYQPGVAVDGEDLFLSTSENVLFFRNAQDNALYYINL